MIFLGGVGWELLWSDLKWVQSSSLDMNASVKLVWSSIFVSVCLNALDSEWSDHDQILPPDLYACYRSWAIYHCSCCLRLALHDLSPWEKFTMFQMHESSPSPWLSLSTIAWYLFPSLLGRASKSSSSSLLLFFFDLLFLDCLPYKNPPFLFHLTLNGL